MVEPVFPVRPEQLTATWLSEALGAPVDTFEVSYFADGTGVMAWVMRLLLSGGEDCPASAIIKFPSAADANRATAAAYNMYAREVQFYRDIAPSIPIRTPTCYAAEHDPSSDDFVILMEDLADMRIGDQVEGCSTEEAKAVIRVMARLHASGWQTTEFPGLICHNNPMQRDGMVAGFGVGWPVVLKQWPELISSDARRAGLALPAAVGRLLQRMCEEPVCLTHADVRLDNIFFGDSRDVADAGGVALVDWQSICTSAPEQDLAYFVTQSITPAQRAATDFVATYHSELTAQGIHYDLDVCRERFRVSALYLMCYAVVIAGTLDLANERGEALARTILTNCFTALEDLDAFALL